MGITVLFKNSASKQETFGFSNSEHLNLFVCT